MFRANAHSAALALALSVPTFATACETGLALEGTEVVKACGTDAMACVPASRAVYEYAQAYPDSENEISISTASSPWRVYGPDGRIMRVEELAAAIRQHFSDKTEKVFLLASWTDTGEASLARQLSDALDGMPVTGIDGFLWLSADGSHRATRQAHTLREGSGFYELAEGGDVLVPLAHGWAAGLEQRFIDNGDNELLLHAAIGWDVFYLCPDKALAGFELAAAHGDPIAAYNAALMRMERKGEGDREAARRLLERAVSQGDRKSSALLQEMDP